MPSHRLSFLHNLRKRIRVALVLPSIRLNIGLKGFGGGGVGDVDAFCSVNNLMRLNSIVCRCTTYTYVGPIVLLQYFEYVGILYISF